MRLMNTPRFRLLVISALLLLILFSVFSAVATANSVPISGLGEQAVAYSTNLFRPSQCTGSYANLFINTNGGNQADLILGTPGNDTLNGNQGNDCILGGAGNDTLNGGAGIDILIGGAGVDNLVGGGGNGDTCYGTVGTDSFSQCENIINVP